MAEPVWVTSVDTDAAEIAAINRNEYRIKIPPVTIEVGQVAAACYVRFARMITEEERAGLRAAILAVSPLIEDIELIGGLAPSREFTDKVWKTRGEFGLMVDDAPVVE